jgi:putative DNA primase/helicase
MSDDIDRSDELRDWYAEDDLPDDGFEPIPGLPDEHYGEERLIAPPAAPLPVASLVYDDFRVARGLWTLRAWRGGWMIWRGAYWTELDTAQLRSHIYRVLSNARYEHETNHGIEVLPWNPGKHKIANVIDALAALAHLGADIDPPAWIKFQGIHSATPEGPQLISCTNGLLDVPTRTLLQHTPGWFNMVSVPFAYDDDPGEPVEWLDFLESVWGDDQASIMLLQEYIGYLLSGHTHMQKMLLLAGPTRSGKGTIGRLLKHLLGRGHVTGPTLASLGTNFGMAPLLGKPLAIVSDARLGRESSVVVERLLSITGEDTLTVDRKYSEPWTGKLPTRFVILTNELPRFRDASGAIANRMLVLQLTESYLGREDHELDAKITRELPAILQWALEGLDRLLRNDRFTVPASSTDAVTMMMDLASPVSAFVRECCVREQDASIAVDDLYAAWKTWAEDNGHRVGAKSTFGRDLRAVAAELKLSQPTIDGKRVRCHSGIRLRRMTYSAEYPVPPVREDEVAGQPTPEHNNHPVHGSAQQTPLPSDARDDPVHEKTQNPSSEAPARAARAKTHSRSNSARSGMAQICCHCGQPVVANQKNNEGSWAHLSCQQNAEGNTA